MIWPQGESEEDKNGGYLGKLKTLVSNLRPDLGVANLPFIAGQIAKDGPINTETARLPATVHASGFVSSEGLTTFDGTHFDTRSQLLPGERYAEAMIRLQASQPTAAKPPSDLRFIDPHVHAMSVTPDGLHAVAKWMEERNVGRCVVSPLNHQGSRPRNKEERQTLLENFRAYKGRVDRMAIIDPGEVDSVEEAVAILQREKADGAVAFGEHYGKDLLFDDPRNLMLFEWGIAWGFTIPGGPGILCAHVPRTDFRFSQASHAVPARRRARAGHGHGVVFPGGASHGRGQRSERNVSRGLATARGRHEVGAGRRVQIRL